MPKKKLNKKDTKAIKAGSMLYEKMDEQGITDSIKVSAQGIRSPIITTRIANPTKKSTARQQSKSTPPIGKSRGGAPPPQRTHLHRRNQR